MVHRSKTLYLDLKYEMLFRFLNVTIEKRGIDETVRTEYCS